MPSAPAHAAEISVVVIEDQSLLRSLLSHVLAQDKRFHLLRECADGTDAVACCLELRPDLVIIDAVLPGTSGAEVIATLRPALPQTRFLGISAYKRPELVRGMIAAGANGFVFKDLPWEKLLEAMQALAEGREHFDATSTALLRKSLAAQAQGRLTAREQQILRQIAEGHPLKAIADQFGLSVKTINNHVTNLKNKLAIHDTAQLVRYAIQEGLVVLP
jgi:DNA-binding NarL/FixJ family response regulator